MTDQELIASLFVSDEGELRLEPDWTDEGADESGWCAVVVSEAVAAGILRLIRERDEARAELKALQERAGVLEDALHGEYCTSERWKRGYQQATVERDEARAALERYGEHDQRCASDGYYHSECNCGFTEVMNRHNPGALEAKEEPGE